MLWHGRVAGCIGVGGCGAGGLHPLNLRGLRGLPEGAGGGDVRGHRDGTAATGGCEAPEGRREVGGGGTNTESRALGGSTAVGRRAGREGGAAGRSPPLRGAHGARRVAGSYPPVPSAAPAKG